MFTPLLLHVHTPFLVNILQKNLKKHEKTRVGKSCDMIDLNNQFYQKFH